MSFSKEDLAKIDEAIRLLENLYGFAPKSRAELVRIAVKELLEAKTKEWAAKHPSAARLGLRDPRKKD